MTGEDGNMSRHDEMKRVADAELGHIALIVSRTRMALETAERRHAALTKYWTSTLEDARRADDAEKEKKV